MHEGAAKKPWRTCACARRCRELLKIAVGSEIVEQLTVWARDFDEEANKIDAELAAARRALHHSMRRLA